MARVTYSYKEVPHRANSMLMGCHRTSNNSSLGLNHNGPLERNCISRMEPHSNRPIEPHRNRPMMLHRTNSMEASSSNSLPATSINRMQISSTNPMEATSTEGLENKEGYRIEANHIPDSLMDMIGEETVVENRLIGTGIPMVEVEGTMTGLENPMEEVATP